MWDKPFEAAMLNEQAKIVINCPEEDLERELAAILGAYGITYPDGKVLLSVKHAWKEFGNDFCYFVSGKSARRGPKHHAEADSYYGTFEKCMFYGESQDEVSDESFCDIIRR